MMSSMEIRESTDLPLDEVAAFVQERVPMLDAGIVRSTVDPATTEHRRLWVAHGDDGALAGLGLSCRQRDTRESWRFTYVVTRRDRGGRGLGGRLWSAVRSGLDEGADLLVTVVFDGDEAAAAAASSWGFTVMQHSVVSELDLTGLQPMPDAGDDVTFEACDDLRFDDEDAVARMVRDSQTNPEAEAGLVGTLEGWRSTPGAGQRLVAVLARVDGWPAAISVAIADGDEMHVRYTGVDRALRGRALGRRTKEFLHSHAVSVGVRLAITDNEDGNTGIRHVNEQLGYR